MSYSYRLSRFAAVGWIAVVCVLGSARAGLASEETGKLDLQQNHIDMESAEKPNGANKQGHKNNEAYFESLTSIDTSNQDGAAYPHKQDAQNTQNQPTDDYNRRSAVAAELQAYVGVLGFLANLLTLYLIFKTYEATRNTANASIDSADAAKSAVNIARDAFDDSKNSAADSAIKIEKALDAAQETIRQFELIADANAALVAQAKRSADAAERISVQSAENARESLRLTGETMEQFQRIADATLLQAKSFMLDKRPILYPTNGIVKLSHGHNYIIEFEIVNIGTSIGFIKNINTKIIQRKGMRGDEHILSENTIDDTYFIRDEATVKLGRPIGKMTIYPDGFEEIINNSIFIIIVGGITYLDSFERKWISSFRFEFVAKSRDGGKLYWVPNGWKNEQVGDDDAKS